LLPLVVVVDEHFSVPLCGDKLRLFAVLTDQQAGRLPDDEFGSKRCSDLSASSAFLSKISANSRRCAAVLGEDDRSARSR
jgi:hypothetical protein